MRRHVILAVAIAALVVAVALLRPRPTVQVDVDAPAPATPRIEEPPVDADSDEDYPAALPIPLTPKAPVKEETARRPQPVAGVPAKPSILTVVDPDGAALAEAVVFSVTHSYGNLSSKSKIAEHRTDGNGELKITVGPHDTVHFVSYKVGVGSGIVGPLRTGVDATLKYEKDQTISFKCVAPHGVALESAEVILTTEVLLGTRRDAYGKEFAIVVTLPPRKLLTDREGLCAFRSVLPPRQAKTAWPPVPGFCHGIKATWHTMWAQETIEKPPAGTVTLVLDQ